ncbi:MAG: hypothetical protein HFJ05_08840 [Eubacterium sp.]|nr:hypothetical protein [Eubacterium sp.]
MNTKSIPACLALVGGFVTCIISFMQHVDTVVFAKRFIIVCIIFFVIGTVASVIINMNFNEMAAEEEADSKEGDASLEDDQNEPESGDTIEEEVH